MRQSTIMENGAELNAKMGGMNVQQTTTADDKYSEGIELSNACREYYHTRQRTAEELKTRLTDCSQKSGTRTTIDTAMDTLRKEMASLMDVDLSLMKQLLTMNEAIEDLKCQRDFRHRHSSTASSLDMDGSDWSVSETDMYGSGDEEDLALKSTRTNTFSELDSEHDDDVFGEVVDDVDNAKIIGRHRSKGILTSVRSVKDLNILLNGNCFPEQNSFDSGIYG